MQSPPLWQAIVLFLLTLLIVVLCFAVALPFLPAITGAVAIAVATRAPYDFLSRRLRRQGVAAGIGLVLVIVLLVVPAILLGKELVSQFMGAVTLVRSGAAEDWFNTTVGNHPAIGRLIAQIRGQVDLREVAQNTGAFFASRLQGVFASSIATLTQIVLMLFTLFFLFRDRKEAIEMVRSLLPLNDAQSDRLMERMHNTISATVQGGLTIAAIQGCLGGIMFWILGVPNALLWSVAMAALATIPSLGTFLIWMPVALFLGITGHWVKAGILTAWGTFVIGTVDNLLYPTLVGTKLRLHTVPVLFAVLGGIGIFGISGIVLGPLALTTAVTLLSFWKNARVNQ